MRDESVASRPQRAPGTYRELPPKVVISDGDGLWEEWHGSGMPTDEACGDCGNTEGNLKIYGNTGTSYPNGNSWDDFELVCARCGRFTYVTQFTEG